MNILILGPESRNEHVIEFFESKGYNLSLTTEPISLEFLDENNIDFLISYGYAPVLKPPVTTVYRNRIINIHPAHLPEGRGIYTNFWSFFEGRVKGVSVHFINEGIDTGDIIARREVSFSDSETLKTTHIKLDRAVEQLFFEVWDSIAEGTYEALDQTELSDKQHYRNRIDSEALMDLLPQRWDTPVRYVEEMGAEFHLSAEFWRDYEQKVSSES